MTATGALGADVSFDGVVKVVEPLLTSLSTVVLPALVLTTFKSDPLTFVKVATWVSA